MIEKGIKDFYESSKEFWALVGLQRILYRVVAFLRCTSSLFITSIKGKLEVSHEHYERLGTASVDDQ